ncbi:MAG: sulfatase-like hydrolase/transferase, partial [Caldilineaceae bacterium SB0662_bin_25]|nr:sulfatase-like hydrolase/transferase [Caldilineaceae bacterium SB0662_bin_25]
PPYDPTPRFSQAYVDKDLPLQPVTEQELAGQPPPFLAMRAHNAEVDHDSVMHLLDPTREQRHRQRAYYMANVSMIDEKVGELLAALEEQGYLENAVVIFTSDHGDCLGDHGHSQKWTMYDIITRVPTIVWAPNRFAGGRSLDQLCSLFDLGPTILELAGLETPEDFAAESLLPALEGESWPGRETVFAEHCRDGLLPAEYMSMARTKDWKLVHFVGEPYGQLFDLVNDPGEVNNLWDDPAHAARKEELLHTLLTWRIRSGLNAKDWAINSR